jgi:hypothetical protein
MTQLSESTNPFRKRIPQPIERSNLPGYVVQTPAPTLVATRKRPDQTADSDLMKVYHNALKALYQLGDSPRLYYLQDEMKQARTLLGQPIQHLNGQAVQELVPENQKLSPGDYWRVPCVLSWVPLSLFLLALVPFISCLPLCLFLAALVPFLCSTCAFSLLHLCLFLAALVPFLGCPCAFSCLPLCLCLAALVPFLACPLRSLAVYCYSSTAVH